jgi:hypothetical protein
MRIEKLHNRDIQKMSDTELHHQREQFVQVFDKLWKDDCWPGVPKDVFIKKYTILSKEMDRRNLGMKPRDIDIALLRKSLVQAGRPTPEAKEPQEIKGPVRILKADSPERIVLGIVAEPDVEDSQGDQQTAEEIEKASNWFMEKAQKITIITDENHDNDDFKATLLENYIARVDMSLEGEVIKKGTWLQALRLDEETWEKVESGELTGFSMAGTAIREPD